MRSAGFRFALLFAALFAGSAVALAAMLWWGTAGALNRQTDAAVRADVLALTERWRETGPTGLAESIDERLAGDVENETIYLLVDPEGRKLAGNLDRWPGNLPASEQWSQREIDREGLRAEARLRVENLPGGYRLLVGRDVEERERLRELLLEALIWSAGAVLAFALLGAWLVRRALEKRLLPTYATAAAIAGGDLGSRVPLSGRGDEFDRLASTMNAMLDRIARLMDGVRGVSDAIAHDLRTPIARARGRLEEALITASHEEDLRGAVERGIADLDGVTRVFQALLRIAEAEAGSRRAAFAPVDLSPLLADAAEYYAAEAEARGQQLQTDLPPELTLDGDRDLLIQAVANLLDNAVKFTPPGGTVRLEAATGGGVLRVAVTDEGPGIAAADRLRAGERFFRADAARTTPGSGLGLSLVQAVAHLHGGTLELLDAREDGERRGLRAVLVLPRG
ncbi:HAMP domain-containing histidine kinase [Roseomonas sp. NAR14]|uniref:histidine kinase n=2 Tax=Roseomonas acroporae TaxID=2937791 RepID=A0A9X1Y4F4_9PROT|nr:HAMP domain-containing sensor histidine kinase [Roseomonas acroporae]MCK8783228.1 HAMP domain-containing histidine kinase [Roseomonas acroporae]